MTTNDYPISEDSIYLAWQISSLGRRVALAAGAFIFEAFIAIAVLILTTSRTEGQRDLVDNLNTALLFISILVVPVASACWWIWRRDSARLREFNARLLNNCADVSNFTVPGMSPFTMKYAPEAAAILVAQAIAAVYLSAVVPVIL